MTVQFDALRNSYADTIHITISAKSYPSMTSYVRLYLFITGTKFLSFAARLLQQEARPQGDLEQNMVVYFTTTERERERERERETCENNNKNCTIQQIFGCELPVR